MNWSRQKTTLGSGVSGHVETYNWRGHGIVAVKKYEPKQSHETQEDYMFRVSHEYHQLRQLSHINVIRIFQLQKSFLGQNYYLYMEVGSSRTLKTMITTNQIEEADELLCLFKQIASAVHYLHSVQICHRDLKLDNLLIGSDGFVKLIDFVDSRTSEWTVGLVGTENYIAPEVFTQIKYKGTNTDIWSLGIILHFFLTRRFPWKSAKQENRQFLNYKQNPKIELKEKPEAHQFLLNCLNVDPATRWDSPQLQSDFWFQNLTYCHESGTCSFDHSRLFGS